MKGFDLRTATYDIYEDDENDPIEIAGLNLADDLDLVETGTVSGDWETSEDAESD